MSGVSIDHVDPLADLHRGRRARRRAPSIFIGRDDELARLDRALSDEDSPVRCACILGLPGVGKSALARHFAAGWRGRVFVRRVRSSDACLVDDLRRVFGAQTLVAEQDEEGRIDDLAARLDAERVLLMIEDADRLDGVSRSDLAELIDRLGDARVIATGRGHVFPINGGPERAQIVLGGLDQDSARKIWAWLDELYGACVEFSAAWGVSLGNPFYLRRAHAGDRGDDPLRGVVANLAANERDLVVALALAELPLTSAALTALAADSAAGLDRLTSAFVVEPVGADAFAVHDLVRAAVLRSVTPVEAREAHRRLAAVFGAEPVDAVTAIREQFRHLLAADRSAAARRLVLDRAGELIRRGASGDLIRCLDALVDDGDVEVRLCRARVLARMLHLRRAHDELTHLNTGNERAGHKVRVSLAHVAMLAGHYESAERISWSGLAEPELDPTLRVRYLAIWVFTRTYQGHGAAARDAMALVAERIVAPIERGYLHFIRAFSFWLEERDVDAEEEMRYASALLDDKVSVRATVLGPTFWITVLARVGKIDEGHSALSSAETALDNFDDPLMRVSLNALRATLLESQGDFAEALSEMLATERWWARGGHQMGVLWARLQVGRLLLLLGRAREGHQMLDNVARAGRAAGAELIARQVEAARRADPRIALTCDFGAVATRPGDVRRAGILATLRAAATGRDELARNHLAVQRDRSHDAFEQAMLDLARAVVGIAHSEDDTPPPTVEEVATRAARAGADPDLILDLARQLEAARLQASTSIAIRVDRRAHAVRTGEHEVSFRMQPRLRALLYTMLDAPNRCFDKPALAASLWPARYVPSRHDNALWVNVKRLRDRLVGTGLGIVCDETGYRVAVAPGYELRNT